MRPRHLLALVVVFCLCAALPAGAEITRAGDVMVSFRGGVFPKSLPRDTQAPISIHIAGVIRSIGAGTQLPQLQRMTVALNNVGGRLFDHGLSTCNIQAIQATSGRTAMKICGDALVGTGSAVVQLRFPEQTPFPVKARIHYFNGVHHNGHPQVLAQVYMTKLPISYVVPFRVLRQPGRFGTVLSVSLPRSVGAFAYVQSFEMTLKRTFSYRGQRRSYLSASCAAPAGFPGAVYPLAQITYDFDAEQSLTSTIVRSCSVRKQ